MKIKITPRGQEWGDRERGTNESVVTRESSEVQQLDQHSQTSHNNLIIVIFVPQQ
jgi:hypothetical protein